MGSRREIETKEGWNGRRGSKGRGRQSKINTERLFYIDRHRHSVGNHGV